MNLCRKEGLSFVLYIWGSMLLHILTTAHSQETQSQAILDLNTEKLVTNSFVIYSITIDIFLRKNLFWYKIICPWNVYWSYLILRVGYINKNIYIIIYKPHYNSYMCSVCISELPIKTKNQVWYLILWLQTHCWYLTLFRVVKT